MIVRSCWYCLALIAPVALAACGDSPDSGTNNAGGGSGAGGGQAGSVGELYPINPSAAARAAVLFGSCIPDDRANAFLSRIYSDSEPSDSYNFARSIQCLSTKTNGCVALKECLGAEITLGGPCPSSCSGNVSIGCDDPLMFSLDCGKLGLTCVDGNCLSGSPEACDVATYKSSCVDGAPHVCSERERIGPKCADLGLVCESGTMDTACVGSGATCQAIMTSSLSPSFKQGLACDGSKLTACVNGKTATRDCAGVAKGFGCHTNGGAFFCGQGSECNPNESKGTDTCEGDSVVLCHGGKIEKIDCKALGFAGCLAAKGVCVPSPWQP